MILEVRQTLIDLGTGGVGEAAGDDAIHGLTVLEQTDHVVDTNARAFNNGVAAVGYLSRPQAAIDGGHSGGFAFQTDPEPSDATEHAHRLGLR